MRYISHLGRGVAQSGSAPVLGTGGRKFESCRPDHYNHSVFGVLKEMDWVGDSVMPQPISKDYY